MHWADVVADKLLESGKEHIISSGITPSGPIHLGSMREILTADAIVRAVNDKGGNAKLIYVADNADPLRKVYPFLDKINSFLCCRTGTNYIINNYDTLIF